MRTSIDNRLAAAVVAMTAVAGCTVPWPHVWTPAANPAAPAATLPARSSVLGLDPTTRKTEAIFAAVGADRLEGLKPAQSGMAHPASHGGHPSSPPASHQHGAAMTTDAGKTHSGPQPSASHAGHAATPSAPAASAAPAKAPHAGHPTMPDAPAAPVTGAAPKQQTKALADEMKKVSEEMKATAEALQEKQTKQSPAPPTPSHRHKPPTQPE